MARRPVPSPRKSPRRRNSQQTVDAILDAAALLLEAGNIDALTTNKIAARAGVSIGSLYQYFPNREAIIRELAARQWTRAAERLSEARERTEGMPFPAVAEACVRVLASTAHGVATLRRALLLEVPRAWIRPTVSDVHAAVVEQTTLLIRAHGDGPADTVETRAFVLTHAVQGAVDAALVEHPEWFSDEARLDGLVEDLTRMVVLHATTPVAPLEEA